MTTWHSLPSAHDGDDRNASVPSLRNAVRAATHSRKLAVKSKRPAVTTPRVDFGSSCSAIGSLSSPFFASTARDHSTCRFFDESCTSLSSNECRAPRVTSARASSVFATPSSAPPLPNGPCDAAGPSSSSRAVSSGLSSSFTAMRGASTTRAGCAEAW
eukprot:6770569-Prymnesium_polylepis.1